MEINIYTKDNCDFCKQLVLPKGLNIKLIDIEKGYKGFTPGQVPVIQYNGMNLEGPHIINTILDLLNNAQNGNFKK